MHSINSRLRHDEESTRQQRRQQLKKRQNHRHATDRHRPFGQPPAGFQFPTNDGFTDRDDEGREGELARRHPRQAELADDGVGEPVRLMPPAASTTHVIITSIAETKMNQTYTFGYRTSRKCSDLMAAVSSIRFTGL